MSFTTNLLSMMQFKMPPLSLLQQKHNEDYDFGSRHVRSCRACNDFKTWVQANQPKKSTDNTKSSKNEEKISPECPLDKDELGRNSWALLHTMSVYYPEKPSKEEQELMKHFIKGLARFYPCEACARDFQADINDDPPHTESRRALSNWWCKIHNRVNKKLGKPEFDCSKLEQRWLDGWNDGSCD